MLRTREIIAWLVNSPGNLRPKQSSISIDPALRGIALVCSLASFTALSLAACATENSVKDEIATDVTLLSPGDVAEMGSTPVQAVKFQDASSRYILALFKRETTEPLVEYGVQKERVELHAILFRRTIDGTALQQVWELKDAVDCIDLDIGADFFQNATAVTDLDRVGRMEVTFAYSMICSGGVDPKEIKVVMRNGDREYEIEGESLIMVGHDPPYGGGYQFNTALLSAPQVFKDFMDKTWRSVYIERIP